MNSFHNFNYKDIPSPCYLLEEELLRNNLALIKSVKEHADVQIILAFKAFALWKTFPIFRESIQYSTASSLSEARFAYEHFGNKAHTSAPVYSAYEFDTLAHCRRHITHRTCV